MENSSDPVVEYIWHNERLLAVIVPNEYDDTGIRFFTPGDFSQQLAFMHHQAGKVIEPHVHNQVTRTVNYTQEVLFIKRGRLRVDLYDSDHSYVKSRVLEAGDVILLAAGGHGFEVLEEVVMIEVKQGPYAGDEDKTRFDGIAGDQVMQAGQEMKLGNPQ